MTDTYVHFRHGTIEPNRSVFGFVIVNASLCVVLVDEEGNFYSCRADAVQPCQRERCLVEGCYYRANFEWAQKQGLINTEVRP